MSDRSNNDSPGGRKRRPFRRLHDQAKAHSHDVYSVREIMDLYVVEEQTVTNWRKEGLKTIDGASRVLVRGDELNRFHAARNARAKQPMTETQFFCMSCHVPQEPAPGSVRGADPDRPSLRMEARCGICGGAMYRSWSRVPATALRARPDLWPGMPNAPPAVVLAVPEPARKMRRDETGCDSDISKVRLAASKDGQTAEKPSNTTESDQFSLPLGF